MKKTILIAELKYFTTTGLIYAEVERNTVVDLERATLFLTTTEKRELPPNFTMLFGHMLNEKRTAIYEGTVAGLRGVVVRWQNAASAAAVGLSEGSEQHDESSPNHNSAD